MADTRVPTVLVCGGLVPELPDTVKRVNLALYEAQLKCIDTQRPLQPVYTSEVFPMPDIEEFNPTLTAAAAKGDDDDGDGAAEGGGSVSSASHLGLDIFERLQDALVQGGI